MLNFAEQTGSGAVMLVWSFPLSKDAMDINYPAIHYNQPIKRNESFGYLFLSSSPFSSFKTNISTINVITQPCCCFFSCNLLPSQHRLIPLLSQKHFFLPHHNVSTENEKENALKKRKNKKQRHLFFWNLFQRSPTWKKTIGPPVAS